MSVKRHDIFPYISFILSSYQTLHTRCFEFFVWVTLYVLGNVWIKGRVNEKGSTYKNICFIIFEHKAYDVHSECQPLLLVDYKVFWRFEYQTLIIIIYNMSLAFRPKIGKRQRHSWNFTAHTFKENLIKQVGLVFKLDIRFYQFLTQNCNYQVQHVQIYISASDIRLAFFSLWRNHLI